MNQHLISWYRRDRDSAIVTIATACGLVGERVAGSRILRTVAGEQFLAGGFTTCLRCGGDVPVEAA